jgi:hypothetical protein
MHYDPKKHLLHKNFFKKKFLFFKFYKVPKSYQSRKFFFPKLKNFYAKDVFLGSEIDLEQKNNFENLCQISLNLCQNCIYPICDYY